MNLLALYDALLPHLPASRTKDIKTAIRLLAKALGFPDPQHCPPEAYTKSLPIIYRLAEQQLTGKGPHTIRNVKNNLSTVFRLADQHKLLALLPLAPERRLRFVDFLNRPGRPGGSASQQTGYYLRSHSWPPFLTADFQAYVTWSTAPLIEGRPATWRKSLSTMELYRHHCEAFFGYLHNVRHLTSLTFDQLFEWSLLQDFVSWHVNDLHQRTTVTIRHFLRWCLVLTRQYRPNPTLHEQLRELVKNLPAPPTTYNKTDVWVPLATLEEVGKALWPRKPPADIGSGGIRTATQAGLSLMLRLWCRRPYRQRNMREMLLEKNLYRNADGKWMIRFVGDELKVAKRHGLVNTFLLPFPEDLLPTLEAYLTVWRPLLPSHRHYQNVFLTRNNLYNLNILGGLSVGPSMRTRARLSIPTSSAPSGPRNISWKRATTAAPPSC